MFKNILIFEWSQKAQGLFLELKAALVNDVAKINLHILEAQPGLSLVKMYGWQGKNILKMCANY